MSPGADASEAVPDLTDQVPVADLTETLVDSDGDGLTDGYEATIGLDPMNRNTDGDGYTDHDELNDLGGGNPFVDEGARDTWSNGPCESPSEPPPRSWPSNVGPPLIDEDNDGIHDWDERKWVGTDPTDSDT
ncbi:MAG: hypothetical protein ACE5GB_07690, partial [Acidimicrobiales bacterium]